MLVDEGTTGHGDDLAVGHSSLQALKCYGIGLDVVGGHEERTIDDLMVLLQLIQLLMVFSHSLKLYGVKLINITVLVWVM